MDFQWKEEEPITLFNEELAEFDVVKFEVESKEASYVSGKAKFVILFFFIELQVKPQNYGSGVDTFNTAVAC